MIDQLKSGFTWLYLAAKLRQLRAIAADPASSPAQVTAATRELTKLADSLYRGPEAGPSALIARLEREGIEAAERILPGRTDAPARRRPKADAEPAIDETDVFEVLQGLIAGVLEGQATAEEAAGLWAAARAVVAKAGGVL